MYEVKLSVIIVNYNVKCFLEQCLYSVQAATSGLDTEIFVVDNHSADDSVAYLRPKFPEVVFIENEDNPGFAKANNQAINQCNGEYILLLNPDTIVGDSLRTLCFFMDEHPKAGAVGVKMLNAYGVFLPESKRSFPSPWVSFCKLFGLSKMFPRSRRYAAYSLPYLSPNKRHKVDVLSGAFMLLRHEALDKVGLFDESFFMYGEDIDLSYRMVLGGYLNYYIPERILHYKGESTKSDDKKYHDAFYNAMLIFYKKYYPDSSKFVSALIRLSITIRSKYGVLFEKKNKKKVVRIQQCRILILCSEACFEKAKEALKERLPEQESITLWNLDEKRVLEAVNRRTRMQSYTDMVFCYPDISFDQMLLFMDQMKEKTTQYHVYYPDRELFISPGQKEGHLL